VIDSFQMWRLCALKHRMHRQIGTHGCLDRAIALCLNNNIPVNSSTIQSLNHCGAKRAFKPECQLERAMTPRRPTWGTDPAQREATRPFWDAPNTWRM